MNDYEARQEAKRERLQERAAKKRRQSRNLAGEASDMASVIPMGQPILIGHHSEKRDRNYRNRIGRKFEKAHELDKEAGELEARAASVGTGGISSDDPDAIEKLRAELAEKQRKHEDMKRINRAVRSKDPAAALGRLGIAGAERQAILTPDVMGTVGFASWQLSNSNANIRRIKQRIAQLERQATEETATLYEGHGLTITDNVEANRVQLDFDAIPPAEIRTLCKRSGFRWARSLGVWQRHRGSNATYAAERIRDAWKAHHEPVHLPDYSQPDANRPGEFPTAKCGAENARTMSAHEIKRGRVTCPDCLALHGEEQAA